MPSTPFSLRRDINGYNGFGLVFSIDKYSCSIPLATEVTLTAPAAAAKYLAILSFEPGTSVWVAVNATAAPPAGVVFSATTSELNPVAREVNAGDVLHFYASGTASDVGAVFYAL